MPSDSNASILKVLRSISGPFAFIFLDKAHSQIYFGRDRLGRRSLLYNTESHPNCMEFASTSAPGSAYWKEVEPDAIYQLSCRGGNGLNKPHDGDGHLSTTSLLPLQRHAWTAGDSNFTVSSCLSQSLCGNNNLSTDY
jgi:hypothetical protein